MPKRVQDLVEWRVLVLGVTLFLYSFSYGGITSFVAMYAEQQGVEPRAIYFTAFCRRHHLHAAVHRPLCGSRWATSKVIIPCLMAVVAGVGAAVGGHHADGLPGLGLRVRHRLRLGLPDLRRPPDEEGGPTSAAAPPSAR